MASITGIGLVLKPSGDLAADMGRIREFYAPYEGRYPELQGPVRLREEDLLVEDLPAAEAASSSAATIP